MHHHQQEEPQGVHQEMPFAPADLLARIVAAQPALFGRLDALAIHNRRARLRVSPGGAAYRRPQRIVHPLPGSIPPPGPDVPVDGLPGRIIFGQHSPGAAAAEQVQDAVDHLVYRPIATHDDHRAILAGGLHRALLRLALQPRLDIFGPFLLSPLPHQRAIPVHITPISSRIQNDQGLTGELRSIHSKLLSQSPRRGIT